MCKLTAALFFLATSLGLQAWAQTPPTPPPAGQPSAAETTSAARTPEVPNASAAPWDKVQEFSAIVTGGPVPGTDDAIHIYRSGNLLRMEGREGRNYLITDLATQETHGMAESGCLKYANSYVRSYPFSLSRPENQYERVAVTKETVDGHPCQVEDVTISSAKLHTPIKIRLWEAEDLEGFPVKIETAAHRIIQFKKVVLGPQDPTFFIFSNQCQVLDKKTTAIKSKPQAKQE